VYAEAFGRLGLTQRLFERPKPPPVHVEIQAAGLETS
jgi:hypothetical protein